MAKLNTPGVHKRMDIIEVLTSDGSMLGNTITRYQDTNGDNLIEIIRTDRYSGQFAFRLEDLLVRSDDYSNHQAEFQEGARILQAESALYQSK